jgi:hypothetical protein
MRAPNGTTSAASQDFGATSARPAESAHLMRAMTAVLARHRPASASEALQVLRRGYPDIPLAMRIAALCEGAK